jgi:predicted metal-dependent hydrolase
MIGVQKEIELLGRIVAYTHKVSKRARTVRLAIHRDGAFVVTTPHRYSENFVMDFIVKKATWIVEKIAYFKKNPKASVTKHSKEEIKKYKQQTDDYVRPRLEHWNKMYNFIYKKVTIKNVTSRWGSCSSKGNLNFSYKIVLIPQELADYIIVHELCHLEEMNHGKKFWALVSKTFPHHKELRKQLKKIS